MAVGNGLMEAVHELMEVRRPKNDEERHYRSRWS